MSDNALSEKLTTIPCIQIFYINIFLFAYISIKESMSNGVLVVVIYVTFTYNFPSFCYRWSQGTFIIMGNYTFMDILSDKNVRLSFSFPLRDVLPL